MRKNYFKQLKKKTENEKFLEKLEKDRVERYNKVRNMYDKGEELPLDYPVYSGYTYFCDDELIISDVTGNVNKLIYDLQYNLKKPVNYGIFKAIHKY